MVDLPDPLHFRPAYVQERSTTFLTKALLLVLLFALIPLCLVAVYGVSRTNGLLETEIVSPIPHVQAAGNAPQPTALPTSTPTPTPDVLVLQREKYRLLQQKIEQKISSYPDITFGVAMVDVQTGVTASIHGATPFIAASTTKVLTAVQFLSGVEEGDYSLTMPLGAYDATYQLQQMINQSNNDSWAAFNTLLGYPDEERYGHALGLLSYDSNANAISPSDMAQFLYLLYTGRILNQDHTVQLLSYMTHTEDEQMIPASLPPAVMVYHKTGILDENLHDVAIVDDGKHPYILAIYTSMRGPIDYETQAAAIRAVTMYIMHEI